MVNQSRTDNDPIHAYNIFDVYYEKPMLSQAAEKEQEYPIYNSGGVSGPVVVSGGSGLEVELDESVTPPVLRVSGVFLGIKLPNETAEKEFTLQGKNIKTQSEAAKEFSYLGKLSDISSTPLENGDPSTLHVYYKEPYAYLTDLNPDELKKRIGDDLKFVSGADFGQAEDEKNNLQLRAFTPQRPTIPFDVYILSDLSVLKPVLGYVRPTITNLHIGVPECPALYLYGQNGQKFTVSLPQDAIDTIPITSDFWEGTIVPGGVEIGKKFYNYLFYTVKPDLVSLPQKEGWVISEGEWYTLKSKLRMVGFNQRESEDAVDYLQTAVPPSPYYLISVNLNSQNYPLSITPRPDTFLHYQIVVKSLDKPVSVSPPSKISPKREGFAAVMWEEKIIH